VAITDRLGVKPLGPDPDRVASASEPEVRRWPAPPAAEAFHGLAGDLVRIIEPHTEADPVGILAQFLAAVGNAVGRGPHFLVEADRHHVNLFALLVGITSKGRKGLAWGHVARLLRDAEPEWAAKHIVSGLSSGEGLIAAVRDPTTRHEHGEIALVDDGVTDKRLLALEPEFATVLKVITRQGNILSPTLRQSWDTGDLRLLTRNAPLAATGAHISVVTVSSTTCAGAPRGTFVERAYPRARSCASAAGRPEACSTATT
jgi:hypothetical protein